MPSRPRTLPVINDHAVDLAVKMGLGLHCEIQDGTRFHRKHYFYADLPKAYQITQYEHAIAQGGYLDVIADGKPKRIRLDHLHLEEDAESSSTRRPTDASRARPTRSLTTTAAACRSPK